MNYPSQPFQSIDSQVPSSQFGNQQPDLIAMLWRWKWLPVLGALLGAVSGLLVWIQMPPQYLAVARVQVVTPMNNNALPMIGLDTGESLLGRSDDVAIMQSQVVLRNAIEIGRLLSNPKLADKGVEDLILWIRDKDRLSVRPGTKEAITNIIDVQFRCDDAELAAEVVSAIIHGYEKFIGRESMAQNSEILQRLAKFRDDYDTRYKKAQLDFLALRKQYPLIGLGSEMKDPFTEALLRANEQLSASRAKSSKIFSILDTIEKSKDMPVESLIQMVSRTISDPTLLSRVDPLSNMVTTENLLKSDSESSPLRRELVSAQTELDTLRAQYGDQYPLVAKILKKVESLQSVIAEMELHEAELLEDKKKRIAGVNATPLSSKERLELMVMSLQQEGNVLLKEQDVFTEISRENEAKSKEMQDAVAHLQVLQEDMNTIRESAEDLRSALERLSFGAGYGGKLMKRLEVPQTGAPNGPFLLKYLLVSGLIGACAFTGLAYLLELADRSYRGPDEIARDLGVPILGHLQMTNLTRKDRKDENLDLSLVAFHKAKSTASEAFRGVRTAIYFGNQAGNIKVIQVTSPVPGDGKSTVAANLAISIAQSGRKTLLLDCDMRRPRLAKLVGVRDDIGLTNILAGKLTVDEALQTTGVANMDVLTCGRRPGNPAELLLSDDFVDVVNALRERYDYIIMDTPPILAVSDPANASACADGVILTLRLRRNLRPIAIRAAQMLQAVNANLLGVAINGVTGRAGYGYGGYRYDGARATMGYGGYGGYGYGATYGYGDYYTSSGAEAVAGKASKNGHAPTNGRHTGAKGTVSPSDDATEA